MHFVLRPTCCSFWSNHILRVHISSTLFLFTQETEIYLVNGYKKGAAAEEEQTVLIGSHQLNVIMMKKSKMAKKV